MNAKTLQEDLESLGFNLSLAEPEMGKEVERQGPAYKIQSKMCQSDSQGGEYAPEGRSEIREDERQVVMVQLVVR